MNKKSMLDLMRIERQGLGPQQNRDQTEVVSVSLGQWRALTLSLATGAEKSQRRNCHSVAQSLWDPMDYSTPDFPVLNHLPEFAQTHVHWVSDAVQTSCPLSTFSNSLQSFPASRSFPMSHKCFNVQWVSTLHQVAKVVELQVQHQSFQWIFRTDFL